MYKKTSMDRGQCLECGKVLYGRSDKKFCSKECKNRFHNNEARELCSVRSRIQDRLIANHDILLSLCRKGLDGAPLEELMEMGFDPRFVTGHRKGMYKHDEYFCFDVRYYRTPTRIFRLRREEPFEVTW